MSYSCRLAHRTLPEPCQGCAHPNLCKLSPGIAGAAAPVRAELDLSTFEPVFATVRRVPIVMAGVEYQLSTGPATFTPEDVRDFVVSQDDPAIVSPRLKIGHSSYLSTAEAMGLANGDDGVPALGKFINIFYDEPSMTAVGDIAGVPIWLAKLMPLMFPNRSIEGFQEALTVTGHTWGLVVHAVALLGVIWPGCATLEDLPLLYTEDGPDDIELYDEEGEPMSKAVAVAASRRPAAGSVPVTASVNVDDVRRAYYDSLDSAQTWWWIRAIYLNPNELIVDDDEGTLYRVAFAITGDNVAFTDPVEVKITFVDASVSAARRAFSLAASGGRLAASFETRATSRPETTPSTGGNSMTPEQLAALGLPATASQAQIHARLTELAAANAPEPPEDPPGDDDPVDPPPAPVVPPAPADPPEAAPPAASPPVPATASAGPIDPAVLAQLQAAGLSVVPTSTFTEVQRNAAAGAAVAVQNEEQRREAMISGALREGRLRPADVQSYRNLFANAATAPIAETLLTADVTAGGLAPGLVPVTERGESGSGDPVAAGGGDGLGYEEELLSPSERSRIAAIKAGTHNQPRIDADDQRLVRS